MVPDSPSIVMGRTIRPGIMPATIVDADAVVAATPLLLLLPPAHQTTMGTMAVGITKRTKFQRNNTSKRGNGYPVAAFLFGSFSSAAIESGRIS